MRLRLGALIRIAAAICIGVLAWVINAHRRRLARPHTGVSDLTGPY
jgi:hypothetical protein